MADEFLQFGECAVLIRNSIKPDEAAGKRYLGLEHLEQGTLHLNGSGTSEDVTSLKSKFRRGDILFGKLRPYFRKVVKAPFDGVCSTDIWVVRATEAVDQGFLFYWMASPEFVNFSMQGSEGTKMPRAKWEHVNLHTLPPLSLPEQKAIAHVLGTLDDKIELNQQMNATLEAMAQALFKSWFVDFDPVIDNALAAGNPIPDELQARASVRESLGDARKHPQNLFPASFTHSEELGWIPEGWAVGPLSRVANLSTKAVSPFKQPDKIWTHYSIPAFDEGIQPTRDLGATIKSGKYKVHDDSVLASKLNPQFPRVWLVDANDEDSAICSTEFMPFRPKRAADRFYLYFFLRSDFAQQSIVDRVTGSTGSRQRVKPREISQLKLVIPPEELRGSFNQVVSGPLYRVLLNRRATADLAKTRDTLLPKLLSGDLRLPIEEMEVAV